MMSVRFEIYAPISVSGESINARLELEGEFRTTKNERGGPLLFWFYEIEEELDFDEGIDVIFKIFSGFRRDEIDRIGAEFCVVNYMKTFSTFTVSSKISDVSIQKLGQLRSELRIDCYPTVEGAVDVL